MVKSRFASVFAGSRLVLMGDTLNGWLHSDMGKTPSLLYVLERQIGLNPERSRCNQCAFVEYIYFTGIVCHLIHPNVGGEGRCLDFQSDKTLWYGKNTLKQRIKRCF